MTHNIPTQPSGILIVDKPKDWTSHDVVNRVRRIYNTRKVGHAGTLDPMATGVLVILIGKATKLSDQLLSQDKHYQATILFGQQTDTADADGQIIKTDESVNITEANLIQALQALTGTRQQQVPAYSAVKINGQKLYNLARSGQQIESLPTRTVTINSITLNRFQNSSPYPSADITISCTKGTYIRELAEEISQKLGTIGHLTALRRIASGQYSLDQSITLDQLQTTDHPESLLIPVENRD